MRSLLDVHEINVHTTDAVCWCVWASARIFQLENGWMNIYEIWYKYYAILGTKTSSF
jgi:hypothetical protein